MQMLHQTAESWRQMIPDHHLKTENGDIWIGESLGTV